MHKLDIRFLTMVRCPRRWANPCTGEDGSVTLSVMGTVRETIAPNGSAHIRGHLYEYAAFTPVGAASPTFFGEDTVHFTENVNFKNETYNEFFHLSAVNSDGTGTLLTSFHFSLDANGNPNIHDVGIASGICE